MSSNFLNEVLEIAEKYGVQLPVDHTLGVKISHDPDSLCGEKTKESIIEKAERKILIDGEPDFTLLNLHDPIRATFVVETHEHSPVVLDMFKKPFPDLHGEFTSYERGYQGIHLNTNEISGLCADIHITSFTQQLVDNITHALYTKSRHLEKNSPDRLEIESEIKILYDKLFLKSRSAYMGEVLQTKLSTLNKNFIPNNINKLPSVLVKKLIVPPAKMKRGKIILDRERLADQAEMLQEFAKGPQRELAITLQGVFYNGYKPKRKSDKLV